MGMITAAVDQLIDKDSILDSEVAAMLGKDGLGLPFKANRAVRQRLPELVTLSVDSESSSFERSHVVSMGLLLCATACAG